MGTIYKIDFDFSSQSQQSILRYLQANQYKLFGFKGASGPNQITAGLPAWFAEPYIDMFGRVEIDYEPLYKVYVYNRANIGLNTTIQMEALSTEVPLGTAVTFNYDGSFSTTPNGPAGAISVFNARAAGTSDLTVGLAAKVNGRYAPFCAFNATPQANIWMRPNEKIALFAEQMDLVSGSVVNSGTNPGCTFEFSNSAIQYNLEMVPSTYGITNAPNGLPVKGIRAGTSLFQLLNS
ncbi:hypothetical protein [Psychroserpens luteolus]|uniref:hypothetical protein n=1 Tax=Psychroserpens luteolus TaxID=2855840 RepID=UPI001E5F9E97|nr:hypothetical protein [Psychroserpens luteolus]MCD2259933.1 hypothetical protein [Psychroserpens luteolus]